MSSPAGADDPFELARRAEALLDLGRPDAALDLALRAVAAAPHDGVALLVAARALGDLGRLDEAVELARRSIVASPERVEAHTLLSWALSQLGDRAEAVAAAERAVALAPDDPWPLMALAGAGARRGDRRASWARAEAAMAMAPDDVHLMVGAAAVAATCRMWRECEAVSRRALAVAPDDARARNNLGVALERQGRRTEALEHFARSASADPRGHGGDNARATATVLAGAGTATIGVVAVNAIARSLGGSASEAVRSSPLVGAIVVLGGAAVVAWAVRAGVRERRARAGLSTPARRAIELARHRRAHRTRWAFAVGAIAMAVLAALLLVDLVVDIGVASTRRDGAILLAIVGGLGTLFVWQARAGFRASAVGR